ncbi:MBL fold metallo-hydrolase [Rhodococcoides yunnanense]|jgi:L-ascorbate metabolism protein UlaG (beta-lactamase superfamily)|uniref:MBL fold metallo-hydrolase n=1 Tax=Rhodococcoides yunnanense TaxID=278209 RepID=UPI0022B1AC84|nr:MBL fold metallo-hydrolase [Rhodococcus yunnanensis]
MVKNNKIVPVAAAFAGATWLARAAWGLPSQIGARTQSIAPYAAGSPRYRGRRFHNTEPSASFSASDGESILLSLMRRGATGRPQQPIPLAPPVAPVDAGESAVTWYGHSSVLVEIDGRRLLADPVWSHRVSPSKTVGPARLHPTPISLDGLPKVDAIVISHDHYDHLDKATIQRLAGLQNAPFVVPIGIGAHLRHWKVPEDRIIELDWDEQTEIAGITITCTEARHFSGRGLRRDLTQWASWAFAGPKHRVFFGGDTGYTVKFAEIGAKYGPFDLTLLPVGAYDPRWADIHMNPEEAVRAHGDLGGGVLVPVHWATFNLAFHPWSEPILRLEAAAEQASVTTAVPIPGQRLDVSHGFAGDRWWARLG